LVYVKKSIIREIYPLDPGAMVHRLKILAASYHRKNAVDLSSYLQTKVQSEDQK